MPIGIPYGLLIKLALLIALVGGIFFAGAHWKQTQWDAAIMEQSVKVAHVIVEVAQLTGTIAAEHARTTVKTAARHEALRKDVADHAPTTRTIRISPVLERVFDDIGGVRGRPDGVPAPAGHPAAAPDSPEDGATLAEVLQAYEYVSDHYDALWDDYHALVEIIVQTDAIVKKGSGN
ncbi:MAG: hypothetical protein Q7R68_11020 [Nitrospirales bacterium]|nr:hypothetical protein [Nitrospirales bacterium]